MCERDDPVVINRNFSEDAGVLFGERISAAFEILENAFELITGQIAKRQRSSR